jgi:uncharacterized protein (DUF488 family)
MHVFTIGFTKKKAEEFFGMLTAAGVERVVDVRLRNRSGYVSHALLPDLPYFLRLHGISYVEAPLLAPTAELLDGERAGRITWEQYADAFRRLLAEREIEKHVDRALLDGGCLLCSEDLPHACHRSLVCEHLQEKWGNAVQVTHLHNPPPPAKPERRRGRGGAT